MAQIEQHGNGCLPPLLVLLALLPAGDILMVSAQFSPDSRPNCGMATVSDLNFGYYYYDTNVNEQYQRINDAMAGGRPCPENSVCAQKVTAEEGSQIIYSEDCWHRSKITEYTEVACNYNLCNFNLTFGSFTKFKNSFSRAVIQCYNHGQLHKMMDHTQIISDSKYRQLYSNPIPVSNWSNGMCGAAIYSSNERTSIIHERVLTGDRKQKFAMLRVCPSRGCDRNFMRHVLSLL